MEVEILKLVLKKSPGFPWLAFAALCFVGQPAWADYRFELDGSYAEVQNSDFDPENLNLSAQWFFAPVKTSAGPLAEAEFLSRASSLRYTFDRTQSNSFVGLSTVPSISTDSRSDRQTTRNHQLRGRYVFPTSGWILTARGAVTDPPNLSSPDTATQAPEADTDQYGVSVGVGRYLNPSTSIEVVGDYSDSSTKSTLVIDCLALFITDPDCERIESPRNSGTETLGVSAQLRRVGKIGRALFATTVRLGYTDLKFTASTGAFEVIDEDASRRGFAGVSRVSSFSDSTDRWTLLLAGTWFPRNDLGVDLGYNFNSTADFDSHTVGAGFGWFVTPSLELSANYAVTFLGRGLDDNRQWRATLRTRF